MPMRRIWRGLVTLLYGCCPTAGRMVTREGTREQCLARAGSIGVWGPCWGLVIGGRDISGWRML